MKFEFIGKPDLIVDYLTHGKKYDILQFERHNKYLLAYVIGDNNELGCIPYSSMDTFNQNWRYIKKNDNLLL